MRRLQLAFGVGHHGVFLQVRQARVRRHSPAADRSAGKSTPGSAIVGSEDCLVSGKEGVALSKVNEPDSGLTMRDIDGERVVLDTESNPIERPASSGPGARKATRRMPSPLPSPPSS